MRVTPPSRFFTTGFFLSTKQKKVCCFLNIFKQAQSPANPLNKRLFSSISDTDKALLISAQIGDSDGIAIALKRGAKIDARDFSPIKNLKKVWIRLDGSDIEILAHIDQKTGIVSDQADSYPKDGMTALMIAAANQHNHCLQLLLKNGSSLNIQDNSSKTALLHAIEQNNEEGMSILLKEIYTYEKQVKDAINAAVKKGDFRSTEKLGDILNKILYQLKAAEKI